MANQLASVSNHIESNDGEIISAALRILETRIIMNPPFRAVKKHMRAALSLLGPGGHGVATLVALVPVTYDHPEAETLETIDRDTFATARVGTKIIRIEYQY